MSLGGEHGDVDPVEVAHVVERTIGIVTFLLQRNADRRVERHAFLVATQEHERSESLRRWHPRMMASGHGDPTPGAILRKSWSPWQPISYAESGRPGSRCATQTSSAGQRLAHDPSTMS